MTRTIEQLFYSVDPEDITDEEFDTTLLPYYRQQRAQFLTAERSGAKAPTQKRVAPPATIDLKDLKL